MLELLVERRIEEAISRGELDDLPGAGRPLELDDIDPLLPEELRLAYRILKNAGFHEPASQAESAERCLARKKFSLLGAKLEPRYYEKVLLRFA
jgi:hypothetical protein